MERYDMTTPLFLFSSFLRRNIILRREIMFVMLLFGMILPVNRLSAQITETKLLPADGATRDNFGYSVSLSGDYALIGAYGDDGGKGSAYIFHREGTSWIEETKLTASDGAASDGFGTSVTLSGNYALIGANGDDGGKGSAYVFRREGTSWIEEAKLTASDGAAGDLFGASVSLSGDHALIGAIFDDDNGLDAGSAYIFHREGTSWTQEAKLTASDGTGGDYFGISSLSGDYALIGATGDDSYRGSAYIFRHEGVAWVEEAKLSASDGAAAHYFGSTVSLSGDYALLGANGDSGSTGSAYIFGREGTSWIQEAKLTASDGRRYDQFGVSVSLSGDYALVGAIGDDSKGSTYVLRLEGTEWVEEVKLTASDGSASDAFGFSVSISGDYALTGAPGDDDNGIDAGSAYVYTGFVPGSTVPVSVTSSAFPVSGNGTFDYTIDLTNITDTSQTIDIWTEVTDRWGIRRSTPVIYGRSLQGGRSYSHSESWELGENKPQGEYVFTTYIGTYPDEIMDSSSATYDKTFGKETVGEEKLIPEAFDLSGNYPNPFNPTTTISYALPSDAHVKLTVLDVVGREVATLVNRDEEAGYKSVTFDASELASGIYFYRLHAHPLVNAPSDGQAGNFRETKKLILMK